ncbi:MAG: hypothetical protein U0R19_03800 [Bryobacteraceae bacterium]
MKSMTHAFVWIAAAAMAQVASAQVNATFTTPFAFATPSGQMPAGKYEVQIRSQGTNSPIVLPQHEASRQRNVFVAGTSGQGVRDARVEFSCVNGDNCRMRRLAFPGAAYSMPVRKASPDERLYTVLLTAPGKASSE